MHRNVPMISNAINLYDGWDGILMAFYGIFQCHLMAMALGLPPDSPLGDPSRRQGASPACKVNPSDNAPARPSWPVTDSFPTKIPGGHKRWQLNFQICWFKEINAVQLSLTITLHFLDNSNPVSFLLVWFNYISWLVVYRPLWKIWVRQLGWWHSQSMESHNIHVPVTTNQWLLTIINHH